MLQIIFVLAVAILLMLPTGKYLYHIATDQKTFADPVMDKFDGFIYKLIAMKKQPMTWKKYALSLVLTNAVMVFIGYLIL